MDTRNPLIQKLTVLWEKGEKPSDPAQAACLLSIAGTLLARAGLQRIHLRTRPREHQETLRRLLDELAADASHQKMIAGALGEKTWEVQSTFTPRADDKRKRVVESWKAESGKQSPAPKPPTPDIPTWENLWISFERDDDGYWETRARSTFQNGEGPFELPFRADDLIQLSDHLGKPMKDPDGLKTTPDFSSTIILKGRQLFDSLFQGTTRDCYTMLCGLCREKSNRGIRLIFDFGSHNPQRIFLRKLPWEWLHDGADFLSLHPHIAVVHGKRATFQWANRPWPMPPRVLHVGFASHQTKFHAAKQQIEDALGCAPTNLLSPRYKELVTALDQESSYDIFHFGGHGRLNPNNGQGELQIQAADGETSAWVAAKELAPLLRRNGVKCVVLVSCHSSKWGGDTIHRSAAEDLLLGGIPMVIGMRGQLRKAAIQPFCFFFYRELAKGLPVESALAQARRALKINLNSNSDWHLPQLMMAV